MRIRTLWGTLVLLLGSGCSLDYEKDQAEQSEKVPQMVFQNLRQTSVKDGRIRYTMEADTSEVFQTRKQVRLKNLRFLEYDAAGTTASEGFAESVEVDSDTNNARILGRLSARSEDQGVSLEIITAGERVSWTNDDQILRTDPGIAVLLRKDDGSQIEAKGLLLDMGQNRLDLLDGVRGTWTPETKDNANTDPPAGPAHPPSSP